MKNDDLTTGRQLITEVIGNIDLGCTDLPDDEQNIRITPDHFILDLKNQWLSENVEPGQFIHVLPPSSNDLLRRPFSIFDTHPSDGYIRILLRVIGEGSEAVSRVKSGPLDIIGPLGNGFPLLSNRPSILVGGGVGIPPLFFLAKKLLNPGNPDFVQIFLGARDSETLICVNDFRKLSLEPEISTEDGSAGIKGFITDALNAFDKFHQDSVVYACGPVPMLAAVSQWASGNKFQCYVSLESKLGCGVGACLGCSIPIRERDGSIHYERICCDGPVFESSRVAFDTM